MARNLGLGLLVEPEVGGFETVLLYYLGGPALVVRDISDLYGVDILNPLATYEDENQFTTVCQYSGFTVKKGDRLKKTWDGLWVLERFWQPRNSQDFVRAKPEAADVKVGAPRPPDQFIGDDLPQVTPDDL